MVNLNDLDLKAPQGAFSTLDMEVFVPEVQKLESGETYLEIGVDKGKSLWIAKQVAKEGVNIYGVDVQDDPMIEGTKFFKSDSRWLALTWNDEPIKLLFIDGDHTYLGCRIDIESWLPQMTEDGIILFHDCDESSPGVVQAVAEFVNSHKLKRWELFKRTDKNTSMSRIQL